MSPFAAGVLFAAQMHPRAKVCFVGDPQIVSETPGPRKYSLKAGAPGSGYGMRVAVGDFDEDGWPDLYVTQYGRSMLYRNNGNGTFSDVTQRDGLAAPGPGLLSAVWFDYDNDGRLDLFVCRFVEFDKSKNKFCGMAGHRRFQQRWRSRRAGGREQRAAFAAEKCFGTREPLARPAPYWQKTQFGPNRIKNLLASEGSHAGQTKSGRRQLPFFA